MEEGEQSAELGVGSVSRLHQPTTRTLSLSGPPSQSSKPMEEGQQTAKSGKEQAIVIDMGSAHGQLVSSMRERLAALPISPLEEQSFTIFRVPAHVREANKTLYEPRMVSIGPYHRRSAPHLRSMEEHKWRYLRDLLSRRPSITLEDCVGGMKALEARARGCYAESIGLDSDEFAEMLLLDSCFIIGFLNREHRGEHDAMCDVGWSLPLIRSDLLLMENQIPFFVLQSFYNLIVLVGANPAEDDSPALIKLVAKYLRRAEMELPSGLKSTEVPHLLHIYHSCFLSPMDLPPVVSRPRRRLDQLRNFMSLMIGDRTLLEQAITSPRTIPCATELRDAGVQFKRKSGSLLDVTFDNGRMEIPYLSVDDSMRSRLMNLVAFEQCMRPGERIITSYAAFMDCIINTAGDVAILEKRGIIENKLPSKEEAALFFNQLSYCGYMDYENHYLQGLFTQVKQYCESDWHKYRARLRHDYCSNPWATLSVIAGLVLLAFTFLQTLFAFLSYFQHP